MNIIQDVAAIIKSISKVDIFINDGVNKTFKELEIDSLDLMNILLEVEEKFNISTVSYTHLIQLCYTWIIFL